jgi:hypothetical protein
MLARIQEVNLCRLKDSILEVIRVLNSLVHLKVISFDIMSFGIKGCSKYPIKLGTSLCVVSQPAATMVKDLNTSYILVTRKRINLKTGFDYYNLEAEVLSCVTTSIPTPIYNQWYGLLLSYPLSKHCLLNRVR